MRCLVVFAHPDPDSYGRALLDATCEGLHNGGHDVDVLDLYEAGFDPCLSVAELADYFTIGLDHPTLSREIDLLQSAEALIFVYPTWWSGLPAILKGFLDRTFLPEVAFRLEPDAKFLKPNLTGVRRLVGVTTYGSPRWLMRVLGDSGRRVLLRAVRIDCNPRCRSTWLGLYKVDGSTPQDRESFLSDVRSRMEAL